MVPHGAPVNFGTLESVVNPPKNVRTVCNFRQFAFGSDKVAKIELRCKNNFRHFSQFIDFMANCKFLFVKTENVANFPHLLLKYFWQPPIVSQKNFRGKQ